MKITHKTFLIILISCSLFAQEQIRIASYNVKQYPANNTHGSDINKVLKAMKPTILLAVELDGKAAVQQMLTNTLGAGYKASTEVSITWGTGNECAVFYLDSVVSYLGSSMISADTRPIGEFRFVTKSTKDTFYVFGVHLKAYPEETTRRLNAVNSLRNRTIKLKATDNYMVVGDFNIFTSTEPGFQRLLDQTSSGYFVDMLNINGSWNSNQEFSYACSYSPSSLKTRLDMILVSPTLLNGTGMEYSSGSFKIFGNDDGKHFGTSINNTAKGANYWLEQDASLGASLINASDHLPVFAEFLLNSKTEVKEEHKLPTDFELSQNYPNPFNPETTIRYSLPTAGYVTLKIYDLLGREVSTLVNEFMEGGDHNVKLSTIGYRLSSGIYFYQIKVGNFAATKKMAVLK